MKRREYKMTDDQFAVLTSACQPTPAMWGSGGVAMFPTPQENANRAWTKLGEDMGFVWDTAEPVAGKGPEYFTAEPLGNDLLSSPESKP